MRHLTRTLAAVAMAVATAVGSGIAAAPAAHAQDKCAGFPDIPATFLCVVSVAPENAEPTITQGSTIIVPGFCYFIGCFPDTPVTTQNVTASQQAVLVFTYNGKTYSVPGSDAGAVAALNGLLTQGGTLPYTLCVDVARTYNSLGLGHVTCLQ